MTGFGQKISAFAAAIALACGLSALPSAFAQDDAAPEATPVAQPYAQPTEFSPVTAGDAERGAPASATAEATVAATVESTPMPSPSPTEAAPAAPMPTDTPGPWNHGRSTISKERPTTATRHKPKATPASTTAAPLESPSTSTGATPAPKPPKAGGAAQVVPENSPFAGMNFGNSKGPTNIKSDSLNLDYQNKAILFTGHVHAVQGAGDLTSDKLRVQYGQNFNDIKMTYADGNVRMSQGTRWITSDHAVLDQAKHLLRFVGNPVVHDGEDQITGSLITVDLVSGKSTVENPRVVIFPKESQNPDNEAAPQSP